MKPRHQLSILALALLQAACGGGSGGSDATTSTTLSGASISGTVPGTVIEAFGDNGSYYAVDSEDNGTAQHPFNLKVPVGVGFELVMTTGEGTPDEVHSPIGWRDSSGEVKTRLMLRSGDRIDLGHVPLHMSRNEAAQDDLDDDGVLDQPWVLDDVGAGNPLTQCDADGDGVNDWDDDDHGGYHYGENTINPQDHDHDGIPNVYDKDHSRKQDDSDGDGLPDNVDANRHNDRNHGNDDLKNDCDRDGYNDDDDNHDGYHDDDDDRDGYHDSDQDHDGYYDDDEDHDGHHDGDGTGVGTCSPSTTTTTSTTGGSTTTTGGSTTTTGGSTTTTGGSTTTTAAPTTTTAAPTTTTAAPTTTTAAPTTTTAAPTTTTAAPTTTTTTTAAPPTTTTTTLPAGDPVAGQAYYVAQCGFCHAASPLDTSTAAGGNDLRGTTTTTENLGSLDGMMAGMTLSPQQVLDMQAFINNL